MKKIFSLLLMICMLATCCMGLISCAPQISTKSKKWSLDLTGFVANVGNATALGVKNQTVDTQTQTINHATNNKKSNIVAVAKTSQNNKNYMVKTTIDYDPNEPIVSSNGIERVSFKKITTTSSEETINGEQYIICKNHKINFIATPGFTYSIYLDDVVLYENIQDNDQYDENKKDGIIEIRNLEKNKEYKVEYLGCGEEITISQDEINGEIDKMYVLNNYTFISFVPNGESKRPADENLTYDTDGISFYDKCDYYSNSSRQSFIVDNQTGYVYALKSFNIKKFQGGCLISANDNFIYDFKINDNNEVEIFSLFTNDTIEWYSCFKDKYGNKFIQNNRLNTYDATTKTYFYVFSPFAHNDAFHKGVNYELTENNEAIKLVYGGNNDGFSNTMTEAYMVVGASIVLEDEQERKLIAQDNFKIYYNPDKYKHLSNGGYEDNRGTYKVENGVIYTYSHFKGYSKGITLTKYDAINDKVTIFGSKWNENTNYFNVEFLEEYNIILEYIDGKLYYYDNVWDSFDEVANIYDREADETDIYYNCYCYVKKSLTEIEEFNQKLVLEDCSVDNNAVLKYGINGNTYYDIVVEKVNGEIVVNQYVKGTYIKPQIKIVLQPLNI